MSNATVGKRVGALSAAFAIALAAGTVGAEVVYEAPTAQAQAVSTIDNNQPLSLTLHKLIGAEGEQGNGTEIDNPSGEPAEGVKYKIELVQPLNNSGDWEKARKITDPCQGNGLERRRCILQRRHHRCKWHPEVRKLAKGSLQGHRNPSPG